MEEEAPVVMAVELAVATEQVVDMEEEEAAEAEKELLSSSRYQCL